MKTTNKLILLLIVLGLSSCNVSSNTTNPTNGDKGNKDETGDVTPSGDTDTKVDPKPEIDPPQPVLKTKTLTIDTSKITSDNLSYYDGGFEETMIDGFSFGFEMAYIYSGVFQLKTAYSISKNYADGGTFGSIENVSPIALKTVSINYKTESSTAKAEMCFGKNIDEYTSTTTIDASSSYTTKIFTIEGTDTTAFKIKTGGATTYIKTITVEYYSEITPKAFEYKSANATKSFSYVSPIKNPVVGNSYQIAGKSYKYYTYNDVKNNSNLAKQNSYTTPNDIANYIALFKHLPVNFYLNENDTYWTSSSEAIGYTICTSSSTMKNLVGEKYRPVSFYSRTSGYASSFINDYYGHNSMNIMFYMELDIDLDGNSNHRDSGRIVVFIDGLYSTSGYVTSFYTDDHYASFQQYNNNNGWNHRFNAEKNFHNYIW